MEEWCAKLESWERYLYLVALIVVLLITKENKCSCHKGDLSQCESLDCNKLLKKDLTYCFIIFFLFSVCLLTWKFGDSDEILKQISFAGTVASIILSVIAIIMTISTETKNTNTVTIIEKARDEIKGSNENIKSFNQQLTNYNESVKSLFGSISDTLQTIQSTNEEIKKTRDNIDKISKDYQNIINNIDGITKQLDRIEKHTRKIPGYINQSEDMSKDSNKERKFTQLSIADILRNRVNKKDEG